MQSPTIGKLAEALAKAQKAMRPALKDSENPYFKSRYADLNAIWDAIRGPLTDNGLSVVQAVTMDPGTTTTVIETTLLHVSGEFISGRMPLMPIKPDPQAQGSAITYGRRYALSAMVGITSDEDDDGNAATHSAPPRQQAAPRPAAPPAPAPKAEAKSANPETAKAAGAIKTICDIVAPEFEPELSELEFCQAVTGGKLDTIEQIKEAARLDLQEKRGAVMVMEWARKADQMLKDRKAGK